MIKVVVATWYLSDNYGTCLQAYALNHFLEVNGIECKTLAYGRFYGIDELPDIIKKGFKKINEKLIAKKSNEPKSDFSVNAENVFLHNEKIMMSNIKLAQMKTYKQKKLLIKETDYFIVGGDQLWNPNILANTYFLPFVRDKKKKLSYGTSFGVTEIPKRLETQYKKGLSKMSRIAVREDSGVEIVRKVANKEAVSVLDPVFLLDKEMWRTFYNKECTTKINYSYALCYFVGGYRKHRNMVESYVCQNNKKIKTILLPMTPDDFEYEEAMCDITMADFLYLIDNAEFVFTDSFHATAFSIIFNRNFYNFHRFEENDTKSQNSRIDQILDKFQIPNRYLKHINDNGDTMTSWEHINHNVNIEIERSKSILLSMVTGE